MTKAREIYPFDSVVSQRVAMETAGSTAEAVALAMVHPVAAACLASPEQPGKQLLVTSNASAPSTPGFADCRAGFATTALSFVITSHAEVLLCSQLHDFQGPFKQTGLAKEL